MLENWRYRLALRAMVNLALHHKEYGSPSPETFQAILDHHYITQVALASLGISGDTHPSEVPRVNTVVYPAEVSQSNQPVNMHVIGMPKTLKTTISEALGQLGVLKIGRKKVKVVVTEETSGPVKGIVDRMSGPVINFGEYITSQVMINTVVQHIDSLQDPARYQLTITNRGVIDMIPFTFANFLFGRLDIGKLSMSLTNIQEGMKTISRFRNVAVIALVSPGESLRRNRESGELSYGRVMNPKFLPLLYEQNLWFYNRLLEGGGALPFLGTQVPYSWVDMSGENIEEPIGRYLRVVEELLRHFF